MADPSMKYKRRNGNLFKTSVGFLKPFYNNRVKKEYIYKNKPNKFKKTLTL